MTAFSIPQIVNAQMKLQRPSENKSRHAHTHIFTYTYVYIHTYIHHTLCNWLLITVRKGILSLTQIGLNHNREKWNIGISIFINNIYVLIGGKFLLQCCVCFCHTTTRISHDFILLYISLPSIFPSLTHPTPH